MNQGFLIVLVPAVVVGACYVAVFHWMGFEIGPAPFAGAAGAFIGGLIAVWQYQRRKQGKRKG